MEFRSSKFIVIKSFIVMIIGAFVFAYIVYTLSHNESYGLITVAILSVLSLLMSISEWRFRVELVNNHLLEYRGSRLKQDIDLENASLRSKTKQGGNNVGVDCKLEITNDQETYYVDCTPLGKRRYYELLERLGFNDEPTVLMTQKKEDH